MSYNGSSDIKENWNVRGTVFYKGLPCRAENQRVPPCSGPYPGYNITVHPKENSNLVSAIVQTDDKGEFRIWLPDGEYVIYTQTGPKGSINRENYLAIQGGKGNVLDLTIDTGVR